MTKPIWLSPGTARQVPPLLTSTTTTRSRPPLAFPSRQIAHIQPTGEPTSGGNRWPCDVMSYFPRLDAWNVVGSGLALHANGNELIVGARYKALNSGRDGDGAAVFVASGRGIAKAPTRIGGISAIYPAGDGCETCGILYERNTGVTVGVSWPCDCSSDEEASSIDTSCTHPPARVQYLDLTGEFAEYILYPNPEYSQLYGEYAPPGTAYYSNSLYGGRELILNGRIGCAGDPDNLHFQSYQIFKVLEPGWQINGWNYNYPNEGDMGPNILSVTLLYAEFEDIFPPYRRVKDAAYRVETVRGGITFRFYTP